MKHYYVQFMGVGCTVWYARDRRHAKAEAEKAIGDKALGIRKLREGEETPEGWVLDLSES